MLVDYDEHLPPVIRILLSDRSLLDPSNSFKALRRLIPELRRQALWTIEHFDYDNSVSTNRVGSFATLPAAAADPFTHYGACRWITCRVEAAKMFCRTFGLYVDTAILPDEFTAKLITKQRFSADDYMEFQTDLLVLWILRPLVRASIIRFRLPMLNFCKFHWQQYENHVSEVTASVLPRFTDDLEVTLEGEFLSISFTGAGGQPLRTSIPLNARRRAELKKYASPLEYGRHLWHDKLKGDVDLMMAEHMQAIRHQAALISTSRLHMLTVREAERNRPDFGRIEVWEDSRSAVLPWVNALTPTDIVRLRDEAADALPRFRESVGRVLVSGRGSEADDAENAVHALRAEAAEVKAELRTPSLVEQRLAQGTRATR